jgi:hypothetical protein
VQTLAYESTQQTGKELRRTGFELAENRSNAALSRWKLVYSRDHAPHGDDFVSRLLA